MDPTPARAQASAVDARFLPPPDLWALTEPLLPTPPGGGRPRKPDREVFAAIYYVLRTGIQWKALPRALGAASTVHDRFQEWTRAGVFERLWASGLVEFDASVGLNWTWQAIDGAMTKAPLGGEATGPNPTDRGKLGTKRHLLTEGHGLPVGLVVTGANRNDMTQVEAVLDSMPVVSFESEQHLCADKGYDFDGVRSALSASGYVSHILSRGQERVAIKLPGYRARRWVVEAAHSWLNRFRRLLVRWEKKADNYAALLHLACAVIVWRRCPLSADDYLFG
ncbi:MAG: IS5 family transposase [Myxococcota bacterium]